MLATLRRIWSASFNEGTVVADEVPAGRNVDGLNKQQRTMRAFKRSRRNRRYLVIIEAYTSYRDIIYIYLVI